MLALTLGSTNADTLVVSDFSNDYTAAEPTQLCADLYTIQLVGGGAVPSYLTYDQATKTIKAEDVSSVLTPADITGVELQFELYIWRADTFDSNDLTKTFYVMIYGCTGA